MKKLVNVRAPVISALSLGCGVGLGVLLYFYNQTAAWIALGIAPAVLIITVWAIRKKTVLRPLLLVLLPLLLFIGGALNSFYCLVRFNYNEVNLNASYAVHGTVKEKGSAANGEYIIIDNITLNGRKTDGNAYIFLAPAYGEYCEEGYSIDFIGELEKIEPFQYGELSDYVEQNIKYRSSVYGGLQSTYGYSFFGSARTAMRNTLYSALDKNTAAVSYAMLTGDTQMIDADSLESFRYGGVAHIFAVSGLHIGIIFGVISFILKKLRINTYVAAVISLAVIFLYSAMCGFTFSSLRAAIMCAVATIAKLTVSRYDGLNSLAVSAIIILSVSPLSIFSIGFRLSVCAVGGIYCFSKYFEKLLKKIKIPNFLASAAGASFGAQLGTLPVMLSSFGYISGAGLLLNIVVLPVLSFAFVLIFLSVMICLPIGVIAPFVIPYAALPLQLVISFFIGAGFENSLISGFGAGLFAPLYFLFVLGLSDKLNIKALTRIISLACGALILAAYVLIGYGMPFNGYSLIVSAYGKGGEAVIKSQNGTALIVTDNVNVSRLKATLNRNYITDIDALIILGDDNLNTYPSIGIDCKTIYVCNTFPQIQPYGDITVNYADNFTACGVEFSMQGNDSLVAVADGIEIAFCAGENHSVKSCDILICNQPSKTDFKTQVFFTNRAGTLNVFDCGDIKFKIESGNFRLINVPPGR